MLVSTSHGFVFVHAPKTGGSALTSLLAPYTDAALRDPRPRTSGRGWQGTWHYRGRQHSPLEPDLTELIGQGVLGADTTAVAVVRHPWRRYYSCWISRDGQRLGGASFPGYLNMLAKMREADRPGLLGARSQTYYLATDQPVRLRLARFENFDASVRQICEELGVAVGPEAPHLLRGPDVPDVRDALTPEVRDALDLLCAQECRDLGYEPL